MTSRDRTNSSKKTAVVVGVLFIISTAAGVLNLGFLVPLLDDSGYLVSISANETQWTVGVLLDLICAGAFVGIAVVIFPTLKKYSETIALGYVVARGFEAVPFVIGVVGLLVLLTLSQEYVQAGTPDARYFLPLGGGLLAAYDWTQLLGPRIFAALAALPLYYLFYRTRLVPRFISVWGLIAAPLFLASGLLGMFGLSPFSTMSILLFLPHALNEMVLAVWLIVKGFNSSAIASEPTE
jgi:hypothetical protein